MSTSQPSGFYVTGGTLRRDAPSYVARRADEELYGGLAEGHFCYVLTSRQMGKSSLMVRTAARLRESGAAVAVLDLTAIGQNLTPEQWYDGLLGRVGQQLDLEDELEDFWLDNERLAPLQRWTRAVREVVLEKVKGSVVFFVDEIDAVRSLPFSSDEFFAALREFYNRRTEDPVMRRLTFCLLGVATPSDLIKDVRTTPFNVGQRIELTDFGEEEARPLAAGLGRERRLGETLVRRVLHWTGGHPYLTQRLCQAVAEDASVQSAAGVDRLCEELFLSSRARERDDNLLFVRERLLRGETDRVALLDLYARVLSGRRVPDDETDPIVNALRLSGIARDEGGRLRVRNRIYGHVFDRAWVVANMPDAELQRQRAAYRRGLVRAAAVAAVIFLLLGALSVVALTQRNHALEEARRADRNAREREAALSELKSALGEAERQRTEAERQKQVADEQRAEAERQQQIAQEKSRLAQEQQRIAAQGRAEAERERAAAQAAQRMAESQRQLANERAVEAETQRQRAEKQTKVATSTLFDVIMSVRETAEKRRAVEYYDKLANVYHETGDRKNEAEAFLSAVEVCLELKDAKDGACADKYVGRAVKVYRDASNVPGEGYTLAKAGDLYKTSGDGERASRYYSQSLSLLRDALPAVRAGSDRQQEAYTLYYLSRSYAALGDYAKAVESCGKALSLFRALQDPVMPGVVEDSLEAWTQSLKDGKK
ncbi:MAG TPA: AAA-like domain-containing protein [Pyrinomonadaceae bacterium]|nr:AAA-like domain-containing protein [Pyrinomonadaceae bacterium]